jgi:predicted nicotinamide N-methyase
LIAPDPEARRAFILANTRLQTPPHTPELRLHLADEVTPIWRMTEDELGAIGLPPPFWAFAWAGGQALARYLLDHPEEVSGKTVVDFATGSGIVAIAAAQNGSMSAASTCAAAVSLNAEANAVRLGFTESDLLDAPPPAAGLILAGDIFYEQPLADRAMAWLAAARGAGARVLIGDPGRSYFPRSGLAQLAEYRVRTSRELEDSEVKRTSVWTIA